SRRAEVGPARSSARRIRRRRGGRIGPPHHQSSRAGQSQSWFLLWIIVAAVNRRSWPLRGPGFLGRREPARRQLGEKGCRRGADRVEVGGIDRNTGLGK